MRDKVAPEEWLKGSEEIQGDIRAAFNKPLQLFLSFNRDRAREWVRRLIEDKRIAITIDVAAHNWEYRELRRKYGARQLRLQPMISEDWIAVGLTSWGLVTLH